MKIIWTQEAVTRLKEIQDYIGQKHPISTEKFYTNFFTRED